MKKEIFIDGLKISYEETGNPNGQPLILLHGWGCNHTTVKSIASVLDDTMRVINIDLPGHGDSGEPIQVWGTEDFAGLIKNIIKNIGLKNPSLIGHSFGGRISIKFASDNEVNKLVLVDAAGITPIRSLKYYYKIYSYKVLKKLSFLILGEKKGKIVLEKILRRRGSDDYKMASPKMRAIMSKCINQDLRNIMNKIKAPVLLIWGENDMATPIGDAHIMEKNIPDAGLVVFPGCGHYSFLDNPIGFKAVLREFFKEEINNKIV